ncbi:hypothetical protein E2C01_066225 [Portunus trituberculatus]|uniref:Uncharacterized protein n=1 Tax=Portunus trituberculatus TaxID=210409 RepID=A0A5B7HP71_PORTR|nr:hypothetical protein [Portunus trituberculatus]
MFTPYYISPLKQKSVLSLFSHLTTNAKKQSPDTAQFFIFKTANSPTQDCKVSHNVVQVKHYNYNTTTNNNTDSNLMLEEKNDVNREKKHTQSNTTTTTTTTTTTNTTTSNNNNNDSNLMQEER